MAQTLELLLDTDANCITELENFQAHLHPAVLETFFQSHKKIGKDTTTHMALAEDYLTGRSNITA